MLRNERYTGVYIFNKYKKKTTRTGSISKILNEESEVIRIEGGLPQIIDKNTFEQVQRLLGERVHRTPSNANEDYLLTGKLICGECGNGFHGWYKKKNRELYSYYKCCNNGRYDHGKAKEEYCTNTSIRRPEIEHLVIDTLCNILSDKTMVDKLYDEYNKFIIENKTNNPAIEILEKNIKDVDTQIENIVSAISQGLYNSTLNKRLKDLEESKKQYIKELKTEKSDSLEIKVDKTTFQNALDKAKEILKDKNCSFERRKTIVNTFLNKIIVYNDHADLFFNAIPAIYCGNFSCDITPRILENIQNSMLERDEDIKNPQESFPREKVLGSPNVFMRETKTPQKLFAKFNNNTYRPPRLKVNQDDLDYNSRLCAFFIILKTVDKEKFLNIKFVKKSCLETLLF